MKPEPVGEVTVSYRWHTARRNPPTDDGYRPKDVDNALGAMKAAQDALEQVRIVKNDSDVKLETPCPVVIEATRGYVPGVLMVVRW